MTQIKFGRLEVGDLFKADRRIWQKTSHQHSVDGFVYNATAEDLERVLPAGSFYVRHFANSDRVYTITKAKHL